MPITKTRSSLVALLSMLVASLWLAGCQTSQQALANDESKAMDTALRRGRFEMSCPTATGTVLSNDMLQPVLWGGIERAEYQVGVSGCGKKATYIVVCPQDSDGCVATSNRDEPTIEPE
jgi:hypothetical protein